jgi:peptide/nickel transport system substrate-binding protein
MEPRMTDPEPGGTHAWSSLAAIFSKASPLRGRRGRPATLARPAFAQTTQKKELVSAQAGDISKFDPHFSTSSNDIRISFNIFDNLTSRHPDGKLYPGLATEWKLEGPTTWRFKLRPGVKFHNGDPFTSADAKWSLERTFDPPSRPWWPPSSRPSTGSRRRMP